MRTRTVPELLPACLTRFTTDDRYIGFVGNIQDGGIDAAAAPLSMASIGPVGLVLDDFASDISFPWSGWAAYAFAPVALYGVEQGAVTPAVLYPQIDAGEQSLQAIAATYEPLGTEPIAIPAALNEPSFAPMVTRAQAENGNPLFIQQAAVQVAQVVGEARAIGYEPIFAVPFTFHDVAFSEAAGSDANGAVGALPYSLDDIDELQAVMDEFGPDDWNLSYAAVNSYVAATMAIQALEAIDGDVSRESLLAALQTTTFDLPFALEPVSFAEPGPVAATPRVVSAMYHIFEYEDGELTQITTEPTDVLALVTG